MRGGLSTKLHLTVRKDEELDTCQSTTIELRGSFNLGKRNPKLIAPATSPMDKSTILDLEGVCELENRRHHFSRGRNVKSLGIVCSSSPTVNGRARIPKERENVLS